MRVRVVPLGQVHARVEPPLPEFGEALNPEVEPGWDELDVSLLEGVVDDTLVLLGKDGASGVDLTGKSIF